MFDDNKKQKNKHLLNSSDPIYLQNVEHFAVVM